MKLSPPELFLDGRVTLYSGDCIQVMKSMKEESVHSLVSDAPYHLHSIVKRFAKAGHTDSARTKSGPHQRTARGFMNKQWDGGDVAFRKNTWKQAYRVIKPGGYLLAFSGTRTYHRMACAIEDAGFVVYDIVAWLYGQGFPKSVNIALEFETTLCERREVSPGKEDWFYLGEPVQMQRVPPFRHPEAEEWYGYGTALKPSFEPVCLARKPMIGTTRENVHQLGTGALNIDGCRIATDDEICIGAGTSFDTIHLHEGRGQNSPFGRAAYVSVPNPGGRFPANVVHDGSDEVVRLFPAEAGAFAPVMGTEPSSAIANVYERRERAATYFHGDADSAGRFFYTAKAGADDRIGSTHPTVKPIDLMQWLVRLVTPKGGIVLDPFAGTGTTGEAAFREGLRAVLIEREPEYQEDIRRRMALCMAGPDERRRESIKANLKARNIPIDMGPLFEGAAE